MSDHAQTFHALAFRPAHARRILLEVAQRYARLWLIDTGTVYDVPPLKDGEAAKLRDYRFTLETAYGGDELPPITEPDWPLRHRRADWTTGRGGRMAFKKGAKKGRAWSSSVAGAAADAWAAALVDQVMGPTP